MKARKKQPKRKRKPVARLYIIIIILLYFILRMPPVLKASSLDTYVAEYGKIEKTTSVTGYIIRDEKVFKSVGEGQVKYFVSEGEKVAKGQKLAEVYVEGLDEKTRKDLEIINLRLKNIEDKQDEKNLFQSDIVKLDDQIEKLLNDIQKDIKEGKYDQASKKKEDLNKLIDKKSLIVGGNSFAGKNISQLEEQQNVLEEKVRSSIQVIYSEYPGIVALSSDGFEDLLNINALDEINSKQLQLLKDNKSKKNNKDQSDKKPVIRIIKNHKWNIVCEIKEDKVTGLKIGNKVRLRPAHVDKDYQATITNIIEDGDMKIVIFELTEFMEDFYNLRTLDIDIIHSRHEGVMVTNSSIIEKDGRKGVYTIDVNGIARFIPVKVKASNKEYAILYYGTFDEKDDKDKMIKINTINLYDEVVSDGSRVKEGQKIK